METEEQKQILFIEEDKELAAIYKKRLEQKGCEVKIVLSLPEAKKYLERSLADLVMFEPEISKEQGCFFLQWMRDQDKTKNVPIVLLTHDGSKSRVEQARVCAVEAYFIKTQTRPAEVVKKILHILT